MEVFFLLECYSSCCCHSCFWLASCILLCLFNRKENYTQHFKLEKYLTFANNFWEYYWNDSVKSLFVKRASCMCSSELTETVHLFIHYTRSIIERCISGNKASNIFTRNELSYKRNVVLTWPCVVTGLPTTYLNSFSS